MPIRMTLRPQQLDELETVLKLGREQLEAVIEGLADLALPALRVGDLRAAIKEAIDAKDEEVSKLLRVLVALYALQRHERLTPDEIIEGLSRSLKTLPSEQKWTSEQLKTWQSLEPVIKRLLSIPKVWTVAKAIDLAYEYAEMFDSARIITDIRPIFDEDAERVDGAVVSFTLKLNYENPQGDHSLILALDTDDIKRLQDQCVRALKKANTAVTHLRVGGSIPSVVAGSLVE